MTGTARVLGELRPLLVAGGGRILGAASLQLAWLLAVPVAVFTLDTRLPWMVPLAVGFVLELGRLPLEQRLRRDLRIATMQRAASRALGAPGVLSEARIDTAFWGAYIAEAAVSYALPGAIAAGLATMGTLALSAGKLGSAFLVPLVLVLVIATGLRFLVQQRLAPLAEAVVHERQGTSAWLAAAMRDGGELATDEARTHVLGRVHRATMAWCRAEDRSDRATAVGRWGVAACVVVVMGLWLESRGWLRPEAFTEGVGIPGNLVSGATLFALAVPPARRFATHIDSLVTFAAELRALAPTPKIERPPFVRLPGRPRRLEAEGLVLSYGNHVAVRIDRLSVELDGLVALEGPNGAGKTTLASALVGLHGPDGGILRIDGVDAFAVDPRDVAFVPQDPVLVESLSLRENVHLVAPSADDASIVLRLGELGLARPLDDRAGDLSRGERQRLALVRALLRSPRLLVLDEPDAWLDGAARTTLAGLLEALAPDSAVIVVSHRAEVLRNATTVLEVRGERGVSVRPRAQIAEAQTAAPSPLGLPSRTSTGQ